MDLSRNILSLLVLVIFCFSISVTESYAQTPAPCEVTENSWRSCLYPSNWVPGYKDAQGRFLHDFSYAGYHSGEDPIPSGNFQTIYDVTSAPYNADNTGTNDAALAIQSAITAAENAGGGIVYLPAGTYRLKLQGTNGYALQISRNNVVLRGAGIDQTFLFLDETVTRSTSIIRLGTLSDIGAWFRPVGTTATISQDLMEPTTIIPLAITPPFVVGDWVVIRHTATDEWVEEHGMTAYWFSEGVNNNTDPVHYLRQVTAVDTVANTITIDTPTRYYLKTRDNARVYKVQPHVSEVGVEHLSVGMRQNPTTSTVQENYSVPGTPEYDISGSKVISFNHVINGWVQDVKTYAPSVNLPVYNTFLNGPVHIHSNGIQVSESRFITIANSDFRNAQFYNGGGGNGHFYALHGNDSLITNSYAEKGRHNYQITSGNASGNVIHRSSSGKGYHMNDFHAKLAQANLIDNFTVNTNAVESRNRFRYGSVGSRHGITNTQSVIWNTNGQALYNREDLDGVRDPANVPVDYIVYSDQHGWGYVIGTRGNFTNVKVPDPAVLVDPALVDILPSTDPQDHVEGEGLGDSLEPQSLYEDQLARRLASAITPTPTPSCSRKSRGDIVCDDLVNLSDLSFLLSSFGTTQPNHPADTNGDGQINVTDLSVLLSNFGQ
ncbi:hypothetical protein HY469_05430 [Candidatus Roizmanbacteria bacterium]|nr:hypothetical protein [Candidatus Roizmanbacteria bacterium]